MSEVEIPMAEEFEVDQVGVGRSLLAKLFRTLGVTRLVVVDDDYEFGVHEDTFLEILLQLREPHQDEPLSILDIPVPDPDRWYEAVRERVRTWDEQARLDKFQELLERYEPALGEIPYFSDVIANLTAQTTELLQLSPARWAAERDRLIVEAEFGEKRKRERTLFLFDLDLAGKEPRGFDGRALLEELRRDLPRPSLLCGILSGMYRKEQEADMAAQGGTSVPPVYLSKHRLDEEPESFAYGVRRTAMVEIVEDVINNAIHVLTTAQGEAVADLRKLNVNEFERVVLQISRQEGIWEADTVFRIYNIYHRKAARNYAKQNGSLDASLDRMREVGGIGVETDGKEEPLELKRIQALEWYEQAENLNRHFLPIELGDIFSVGAPEAAMRYVLLGQPCDLSLRPKETDADGSCGLGGRNLSTIWIVPLVEYGKNGPPRNALAGHYQLPYFLDTLGSVWADFRKAESVSLDVLDLCAFDRNGRASMSLSSNPPRELLPAWSARYRELQTTYQAEFARRQAADLFLRVQEKEGVDLSAIRQHLMRMFGGPYGPIGTPEFNPGNVKFACQRVRRVVQPHAGVLLVKFAQYLSREAFDVDLGRKL